MYTQAFAILWAQWRSIANFHAGSHRKRRFPLAAVVGFLWYGLWAFGAFSIALFLADVESRNTLQRVLSPGLLLAFIYWQLMPIIMVTTGLSLDLNRLLVYPIPHGQLFAIEVLLRASTCFEMLLMVAGAAVGLGANPHLPWWAPLPLVPFLTLNLLLSAALRDLLGRLLARKKIREVLVFFLVILAALPQVLLVSNDHTIFSRLSDLQPWRYSPWGATASLSAATGRWTEGIVLILWTALTFLFGRWQFERSLRFDAAAAKASEPVSPARTAITERLLRIPSSFLPDPVAAMVEKEIRSLSRSPRFRLLFLMGFSFGLLIWLPMAMRSGDPDSVMRSNYLTVVSVYALMLLGEACFWNIFGFDRSAAQIYFLMPVRLFHVFLAKNLAAVFFVFMEITLVALLCAVLGMPFRARMMAEAYAVTAVLTVLLLAVGNMISIRNPRAVDPTQSWRNSSVGRVQAFLLILYPVAAIPVMLAYGARYAFETEAAFYGVLLLDLLVALTVYWIALESSVNTAEVRKEEIVLALSRAEGPLGS